LNSINEGGEAVEGKNITSVEETHIAKELQNEAVIMMKH
jgi:hypothetical protein